MTQDLLIQCLVAEVGYTFTVQISSDDTAERLRDVAWTAMVRKVDELERRAPTIASPSEAEGDQRGWAPGLWLQWVSQFVVIQQLAEAFSRVRECCEGRMPVCALYRIKGLSKDQVAFETLVRGKLPMRVKWLFLTRIPMNPGMPLSSPEFDFSEPYCSVDISVLVANVPEHVKEVLQLAVADERCLYERIHLRTFWCSTLCCVCMFAAEACAVYLCNIDENFIRGFIADFDPANGRVWSVAIERAGLWLFLALAGVMAIIKHSYDNKLRNTKPPRVV